MGKRQRRILGILMSCMLAAVPVTEALAATSYDVSSGISSQMIFPGDSLENINGTVMLGEEVLEVTGSTWTNTDKEKVFSATSDGEGTIHLERAGYVLKVKKGTSEAKDNNSTHYVFGENETPEESLDIACYAAGDTVVLTAEEPAEGETFTGWKSENDEVKFGDASQPVTSFQMPEKGVTVTAEYGKKLYAVTVDGSPLGEYEAGAQVQVSAADRTAENFGFAGWSVDNAEAVLADERALTTTFIMPQGAVNLSTNYTVIETEPVTYQVTVNNGEGSGSYTAGSEVTIRANDRSSENLKFSGWTVDSGAASVWDSTAAESGFTMPEGEVVLSASYTTVETEPVTYQVTVNNGEGSGSYTVGSEVTIRANDRSSENLKFSGWTVDSGAASVWDSTAAESGFTMPEGEVILSASYTTVETEPVTYQVTVNNGEGSGSYTAGSEVTIRANDRSSENLKFSGWTVDSGAASVWDSTAAESGFTMPEGEVVLSASYTTVETEPVTYQVTVNNGEGSGSYTVGSEVTIRANDRSSENLKFSGWTVDSGAASVWDSTAAESGFTMPEGEVILSASYTTVETEPVTYQVTVNNGEGSGSYTAGSEVFIRANDRSGENLKFSGWTVDSGAASVWDSTAAESGFTMPEGEVVLSASYTTVETEPVTYQVTVNNGEGSGSYTAGSEVTIRANDRSSENLEFAGWNVDSGYAELWDSTAAETGFTMAEGDVAISASYVEAEAPTEEPQEEVTEEPQEEATEAPTEEPQEETEAPTEEPQEEITEAPAEEPQEGVTEAPAETAPEESEQETGDVPGDDGQSETPVSPDQEQNEISGENGEIPVQIDISPEEPAVSADPVQSETTPVDTELQSSAEETAQVQSENIPPEEGSADIPETPAAVTEAVPSESTETIDVTQNGEPAVSETEETRGTVYQVEVKEGIGSGEYAPGDVVSVEASGQEGMVFTGWTVDSQNVVIQNADQQVATFVMPEEDVTVTAEYKAAAYEVTMDDGSGVTVSVQQQEGATVTVSAADRREEGFEFDHWEGTAVISEVEIPLEFADETKAETSFTMPAGSVDIKAVYTEKEQIYHVTVANGTIEGVGAEMDCEEGTEITVVANPGPIGQDFSHWEVSDGTVDLGDLAYYESITVTVTQDMDFQAVYDGIEYTVKVNSGITNYGQCVYGTTVTIKADQAPEGMEFDYWYVDSENAALADASNPTTTFTMPDDSVEISAHYRELVYQVIVENGNCDAQSYHAGDTVTVTSNYPASGREFAGWTASSGNVVFADSSRWKTTFTMPAANVAVKATYKDGPSPDNNQIQNLVAGGEYYTGDTITFSAVGAGMENTNPNPGDYRYRPASYNIGNVTDTWQSSPYKTSMAIRAAGEYTLKVIFNKDVYNGNSWVADGTVDTKSVTFRVITKAAGVATGDNTPIALMIGVVAVSGIVFILLLILFLKKRRR